MRGKSRYTNMLESFHISGQFLPEATKPHNEPEDLFLSGYSVTEDAKLHAGVSTYKDLLALERSYSASMAAKGKPIVKEEKEFKRETIGNTTQYRQAPGTSTIYGGRMHTSTHSVEEED